jgi:hypothetical protein
MGPSNDCFAEFSLKKWGSFAQLSPKKFSKFAQVMVKLSLFHADISEKNCRIEIPNLLKFRDNHTNNLQVTNKKVSLDKEKEKDIDKEKKSIKEIDDDSKSREEAAAKAAETKKLNAEFDTFWNYLAGFPHNKNHDTAQGRYVSARRAGFSMDDIKRFYYEQHIKTADDKQFVLQFYKACTIGNLKSWQKTKPVDIVHQTSKPTGPKRDAWDDLIDAMDSHEDNTPTQTFKELES